MIKRMIWATRFLPKSLVERVFALYCVGLLTFILAGLGSFYYYQFNQAITDAHESAALLTEVMAPAITDSVVIGDYDTVKRTIDQVLFRSIFASAAFIATGGGIVLSERAVTDHSVPPGWLYLLVQRRLFDVNRNISTGGRDYGVLRLKFSAEHIAGEIWRVTRIALLIAVASFLFGVVLIRIPLRHWLENLDRIQNFEWEFQAGLTDTQQILSADAPLEIRQTFDVLNRTATSLQVQRARADVTLAAIGDAVVTADSEGIIVYANPVAIRLFQPGSGRLIGRNLRAALPEGVVRQFERLPSAGDVSERIEINAQAGGQIILDCKWALIGADPGTTAGYVLACRDVTETHLLDLKLRAELESRRTALGSLREVIKGLQPDADLQMNASDDINAISQFIVRLSRERARVTALLEGSVRELRYQTTSMDAHSLVSITDADGTITYINEKFAEASGYAPAELVGQNHRLLRSGVHPASFYQDLWETIRSGQVWHGQIANRRKDGGIFWFASTIVPWLDDAGKPYQYVSVRTDITASKEIELALEESRRRELAIGTAIQRSLLKDEVPERIPGAWLASFTEPSQGIDGDFYAIRQFNANCFEILVGDVMGKGVPAALIGAAIKTTYHQVLADLMVAGTSERALPTPARIVNELHRILTPRLVELASFATLALYRFDLEAGTLTFVNAGHTPGLVGSRHEGRVIEVMGDNPPAPGAASPR